MVSTASAPNRAEAERANHVAEVLSMLDRILPEWSKNEKRPDSMDPFKILGLPYDATRNDILVESGALFRKVHRDPNRIYTELDPLKLDEATKGVLWARDAAYKEISNGKAKERLASATPPDPSNTAMGTDARGVANDAMRGARGQGIGVVSAAAQGAGSAGLGVPARGNTPGGPGQGHNHGNRGAGGGGNGPNVPYGHGAADEPRDKKSIKKLTREDAWGDPLQAFVYACNPVVFQGAREALVELQIARLCGVASRGVVKDGVLVKGLGHRMNARELQYAVVGRNDNAYLASGDSWKTRDIGLAVAAGRLMQQEMLLRMTVRNDIQQKMRATGAAFGQLGAKHITLIYEGVGLKREAIENDDSLGLRVYNLKEGNPNSTDPLEKYGSVEFTGIMHEIMNCDHMNMRPANLPRGVADDEFSEPNQRTFGTGADRIVLTREGIEAIKNAVASVSYEAMQKVDHYGLKDLWGMNGTREGWSDTAIALAADLNGDVAYKNGLIKGRFMLCLEALNSLAEGARGWRG